MPRRPWISVAAPLGDDRGGVEDRVVVLELGEDVAVVDRVAPVEGDEQRAAAVDRLEAVHPVGDGGAPLLPAVDRVVPAGPGARARRQQRRRRCAASRCCAGSRWHRGRCARLPWDRRAVAAPGRCARRRRPGRTSSGPCSVRISTVSLCSVGGTIFWTGVATADAVGERGDERVDVGAGAAGDRAPLRAASHLEQAVVVHEARVGAHGELGEGRGVGRPDRRAERHEEVAARRSSEKPWRRDEVGERLLVVCARARGVREPVVGRPTAGSSATSCRAARLKRAISVRRRRNDGRTRLRRWAKRVLRLVPQYSRPVAASETPKLISVGWVATPSSQSSRLKSRVVALVVDDEAGVDRVVPAVDRDVERC